MVKKLIIILAISLWCSPAYSAFWIKYDTATNYGLRCVIDDGVKAGAVTSYATYNSPLPGWTRSDITECADARVPNKKLDFSVVSGSRVVDMTQAEIDARDLAVTQAQEADTAARLQAIDDRIEATDMSVVLTKADNAIDNIGNLNDAKAFLKKLVRVVVSLSLSE